jgi:hypothetical protein
MNLESSEIINRPIEEVYSLVRDNLPKLVPYLPNIDRIEVEKKEDIAGGKKLINHWYAKAEIPSLIKKVISPELLSWKDYANWKDSKFLVEYKLESFLANDLFDASGVNTFTKEGKGKTRLKINCEIIIYPEKVPGVPKFLAKKAMPIIEALLEKILAPNLTSLGKGLNKYFEEN